MKKLVLLLLTLLTLQDTAFAAKEYAKRYPTDTAMEVYTPNNPAPGVPGGSDTQVQFNDGGSFGGDAGLTYNKTTDTLVGGVLAATTYSYAFSDDLGEYIRMDADDNYGYLNSNKSMVLSAGTGSSDIIFTHPLAMADLVSSGTTPRTAWVNLIATNALASSPAYSIIALESQDNASSWLSYNQLFINQAATYGIPLHVNIGYPALTDPPQTIASHSANAFGIHSHSSSGWLVDLDSNSYYERIYQHYTGSNPITQYNLDETYNATDPFGTGTNTATTFTGNVIEVNNSQTENFTLKYNGAVWIDQQTPYLSTSDTMFSVKHSITSIGTSVSPNDIIKLPASVYTLVSPSADTNTGFGGPPYEGVTLYSSLGSNLELYGSNNYNGGLNLGMFNSGNVSAIALFGGATNFASGTVDGSTGLYFSGVHAGAGSAQTNLYGLIVEAFSDDSGNPGNPTGSVTNAIGGLFSVGAGGANITTGASIKVNEPAVFDALQGYGANATLTNKTAVWVNGTYSVTTSNVATGTDLTNMAVTTSSIRMTGSTSTSIHGIHADTFAKNIKVSNVSTANVVLKHQSSTDGTAANRIIVPTSNDFTIAPNNSAELAYDTTQSRWLVTSPVYEYGVYTPTLSNIANVDSSTAFECQYMRVGNTVTVSGMITIDPTTISTLTQVNMTLPVTSNFATLQDVGGTGSNGAYAARILADTTNDRAQVYYVSTDTGSQDWQFTYTYQVI